MGVLKLLTWVFAGLFVACGMPLFWAEDPGGRNAWGGLSLIGLGGFALALAAEAVQSGRVRVNLSVIDRAQSPRLFWAAIAVITAAGLAVLVAAV